MPRAEEENQRIRDERKEKICYAAINVFARKGLAAAKISDIASQAQISLGLFYHYFASKEELFRVLVEAATQGIAELTQKALVYEGRPLDRIRWLVSVMLESMYNSPDAYLMVLQALTNEAIPLELREALREKMHATYDLLVQLVKEGQASGEIAPGTPEELARLYFICIQGIALDTSMFGHLDRGRVSVDTVLRIFKA